MKLQCKLAAIALSVALLYGCSPSMVSSSSQACASSSQSSSSLSASSNADSTGTSSLPPYLLELQNRELLRNKTIVTITGCTGFTALLSSDGEVFVSGTNTKGLLANGKVSSERDETPAEVRQIPFPEKIKLLDCGVSGCVAVGESNTIYLWGSLFTCGYSNTPFQTGIPVTSPFAVDFDKEITAIDFYFSDIIILTKDGTAYSLGEASMFGYIIGRMGTVENSPVFLKPIPLNVPEKITQASSTSGYFFLLGESGKIYYARTFFGDEAIPNEEILSQLPYDISTPVFREIPSPVRFTKISASSFEDHPQGNIYKHMPLYALSAQGELYFWQYETEYPDHTPPDPSLQKIELPEPISDMSDNNGGFNLFLSSAGNLYAAGNLPAALSGLSSTDPTMLPAKLPYSGIECFSSPGNNLIYRGQNGEVHVVGDGGHGELFLPVVPIYYSMSKFTPDQTLELFQFHPEN